MPLLTVIYFFSKYLEFYIQNNLYPFLTEILVSNSLFIQCITLKLFTEIKLGVSIKITNQRRCLCKGVTQYK